MLRHARRAIDQLTERGVVGVHVLRGEELADERRLAAVVHPQHRDAVLVHRRRGGGGARGSLLVKLAAERVAEIDGVHISSILPADFWVWGLIKCTTYRHFPQKPTSKVFGNGKT